MNALELRANLTYLTLAGYEDGEYIWIGKDKDWNLAQNMIDTGGVEVSDGEFDDDVYYNNK